MDVVRNMKELVTIINYQGRTNKQIMIMMSLHSSHPEITALSYYSANLLEWLEAIINNSPGLLCLAWRDYTGITEV